MCHVTRLMTSDHTSEESQRWRNGRRLALVLLEGAFAGGLYAVLAWALLPDGLAGHFVEVLLITLGFAWLSLRRHNR